MLPRLAVGLLLALAASWALPSADEQAQAVYRQINEQTSLSRIRTTMQQIERLGSRLSGSNGEAAALQYAEAEFRRLGLQNVRRETFTVTVPDPEARGWLSGQGFRTELYPLWPNLVRTATCSVQGPLVYGGDGSLAALKGLRIQGSVVLLEFNTGANWRNAAKLGAAAVIFIEPEDAQRLDAEQKFAGAPLSLPRFWLPLRSAAPALAAAMRQERVSLQCRQEWVKRQSANVLADLPPTEPRYAGERVLLSAYVDAMSVVPALAPGAEQASGLAALLETIRTLKQQPRRRPLTVMASGAHGLALQGAREYVERRLQTRDEALFLAVTLDLSSGHAALGSFGRGWFYEPRDESQEPVRVISQLLRDHSNQLAPVFNLTHPRLGLTDAINQSDGRTWKNNIPGRFALDCEPFIQAKLNAITFATIEDARNRHDTPFDTFDRVNYANLRELTAKATAFMFRILNDTSDRGETSRYRAPLRPVRPQRMTLTGGFSTVEGRVAIYDPAVSFVPDVPVPGAIAVAMGRHKTMMGVRGNLVQLTEGDEASYRFIGLAPVSTYHKNNRRPMQVAAFRLDPTTGDIVVAPTEGIMGGGGYPTWFELTTAYKSTPIVVFPCVSIDFYDLADPQDLETLEGADILEATTNGPPSHYGWFRDQIDRRLTAEVEDTAVLFLQPGQRFKLLMGSALGETRLVLTGSTIQEPDGRGYEVPEAASLFLNPPLNSARDIIALNQSRLQQFERYRIISEGVAHLQAQAEEHLALAEQAEAAMDWDASARHTRAAWGFALRAHPVIQSTANDVVNGVVFYLLLLIPFSYFAERLLISSRVLTRQLVWSIAIFVGSFFILRAIHPAFEIVTNTFMIFIAFVMGVLSLMVAGFILSKFESSLKTVKAEQLGLKELDIQRMSVAMAAFSLGVNNMRRRKARTMLTTLTLVVMTFIVLSFTSIVPELRLNEVRADTEARYSGLMLRYPDLQPLENSTYRQMLNEFGHRGSVARRAYFYGADIGDTGVLGLQHADRTMDVRAAVGLDPEEAEVSRPQDTLLPGGRWFQPGERQVMILPQPVADALNINPAEVGAAQVLFGGDSYTVIGILDGPQLRGLTDLDGDPVLPPDFTLSRRFQEETRTGNEAFRSYIRLQPEQVFFVPAETALGFGASLRSIAVGLPSGEDTRAALEDLMPRLRLNLYAATNGEGEDLTVSQFSIMHAARSTGMGLVLVQLAIASIFVLNTMIASVFERKREISIFSAIGLSPRHIAMLFFAESLVYGVLGAVLGYFTAQFAAKIIVATGALPGLYLNFSSVSAVLSAGLVMAVVLASTIYPARQAGKVAAPALEDDLFDEEPEGDEWTVTLPFSVTEEEGRSLIAFFADWFRAYEEYSIGTFVTSDTAQSEDGFTLRAQVWLAPYDLGVSQHVQMIARPGKLAGVYGVQLRLNRISGETGNWINVNRSFMEAIRKQFLTWRALEKKG
jgi:hypothetical protein